MIFQRKRLVTILVPVFNEAENIRLFHAALSEVVRDLEDRYLFEILFTDNRSTDGTWEILRDLARADRRIRAVRFSRNVGYQRSILAGYRLARGDAAVQIDADLQDPPTLLPEFLRRWENGAQVVYGVRESRDEPAWMEAARKVFYRLADLLSEDRLPLDAGDFRLVDRVVLEAIRRLDDVDPYLRGAIAAMGFRQEGVAYHRAARARGTSKFARGEYVRLALDGILAHSMIPLRLATYVGLAVTLGTFLGIVGYATARLTIGREWPGGFATTTILILLSLGLNALFLGILGEYLGRIYRHVRRGAGTIVDEEIP